MTGSILAVGTVASGATVVGCNTAFNDCFRAPFAGTPNNDASCFSSAVGAETDCTAISPYSSGGSCSYVAPMQFLGVSHTIWQRGAGHTSGALHFHSQLGVSQMLRQGCVWGHCNLQTGSEQVAWQSGQSVPGHCVSGQIVAQCGVSHSMTHPVVSPIHRVSHFGGSHIGVQTSSHATSSHFHEHFGVQLCPPSEQG